MPITIHRIPDKDLTTFKCDGDLSLTEIVAVIERFFQGIIAPPTNNILWDMRDASIDTLSADHVNHIADLVNSYEAEDKGTKIAVVASGNISFDIAKHFRAISKEALKYLRVFSKIDEASEWLGKESE